MKLRNKKTGEIVDFKITADYDDVMAGWRLESRGGVLFYDHIDEIKEEWEDYEEPKKYWFIDAYGNIVQNEITKHYGDEYTDMTDTYESQKQIGNYFESEEEAKRAVNKLKAWKRLEDRGFRFTSWDIKFVKDELCEGEFVMFSKCPDDMERADLAGLDLLFGGEE